MNLFGTLVERMRNLPLAKRMFIISTVFTATGILLVVSFISYRSYGLLYDGAQREAGEMSKNYGSVVKARLESGMLTARTVAKLYSNFRQIPAAQRRARLSSDLRTVLETNPDLLGVWSVWEPGALDGADASYVNSPGSDATGRFLSYWNRVGGVHLEACTDYTSNGESVNTTMFPSKRQRNT